jgi:hypothetical protein
MALDARTHRMVQRAVMDSRNVASRAGRAARSARERRELEALRREVERLRRLRALDRTEIVRLNAELEALQEALEIG